MSTTATRRPGKARRRREPAQEIQGLTARGKAALTAIEGWYRLTEQEHATLEALERWYRDKADMGAE